MQKIKFKKNADIATLLNMKLKQLLFVAITFYFIGINAQVIPAPTSLIKREGFFKYNKKITINAPVEIQNNLAIFDIVSDIFPVKKIKLSSKNASVELNPKSLKAESYIIDITPSKITIDYADFPGLIHAFMTIKQLQIDKNHQIECVRIEDAPKYSYRGMHLDVSRHFFDTEFIKKYIKMLAFYKYNTFHWHLTDDQGWRIEIKKYPNLTSVGGYRYGSQIGKYSDQKFDNNPCGGFYTQAEIRDVVQYAKNLGMTVIPEIEMPGHALAAISAYPEFSCNQKPLEVAQGWGVFDDVFCAGNDQTFEFLQNILDEVVALFPDNKFIHIGGDECPKTRWKNCEKCQNRIKTNGLKDEHELQSYFVQRIEKYLNSKGKYIIGWDEILEGGLAPNATVMSWRGMSGGIDAANQNHYVIMTPGKPCYFDHYQSMDKQNEPIAIGGYNPIDSVYYFNPMPKSLSLDKQKYILGAQANVWTEYMVNDRAVEYMTLPRTSALAEALWSTRSENPVEIDLAYKNYLKNIDLHKKIWDTWHWNYRK